MQVVVQHNTIDYFCLLQLEIGFAHQGKMMWFATIQRCLEQRIEEHAPILNSGIGSQVLRRHNQLMAQITHFGHNLLQNWNLMTVIAAVLQDNMCLLTSAKCTSRLGKSRRASLSPF